MARKIKIPVKKNMPLTSNPLLKESQPMSQTLTLAKTNYELGITRLFGNYDLDTWGMGEGWANPEEGHAWNDGPEVVFQFTIQKPKGACRVTFEGEPFLAGACKRQDVALYVNGARVGFWRLEDMRTYTLSAVVEPEHLFERQGEYLVKCVWHLPHSARPADLGAGADSRELGFCFRSFTFTEAE